MPSETTREIQHIEQLQVVLGPKAGRQVFALSKTTVRLEVGILERGWHLLLIAQMLCTWKKAGLFRQPQCVHRWVRMQQAKVLLIGILYIQKAVMWLAWMMTARVCSEDRVPRTPVSPDPCHLHELVTVPSSSEEDDSMCSAILLLTSWGSYFSDPFALQTLISNSGIPDLQSSIDLWLSCPSENELCKRSCV